MSLSLAHSPCPNDTFVFHAWTHGLVPGGPAVHVTFADVDVTNGAAEHGAFDVVKVSHAALPWLLRDYTLLPAGGALGMGCGPLVLTAADDTDPARLTGATVAVPGERTTAYLLFRLFTQHTPPARIVVRPFAEIMPGVRDGEFDAGLVIHEARFTFQNYGLRQVVDLGDWWEELTSGPIPLGAIIARRSLERAEVNRVVRASVEHALAHPAASQRYVAAHATEMDPDVQARHIALYVNDFTRDMGAAGYAAVRELLDRAHAAGLAPPSPPLD